jgi:2-keto-4-pentenoate hydratase
LRRGRGEFVLLGSLVETKRLKTGDAVHIEIEELGALDLEMTE